MYSSTIQLYAPDYPVKSVTVFKTSRAEVVRTFEVDLKAGQNKIEILGLPNAMDADSVRVSGKKGTQELRLFDVFCTISPNAPTSSTTSVSHKIDVSTGSLPEIPDSTDPEEALRIFQVHLEALQSEKEVREHESELLVQYSKSLTAQHAPPIQSTTGGGSFSISAFLDEFVDRGRKNVATQAEIGERIVEVQRRIAHQKERVEKRKGMRNARIDVVLGDQTFVQDGQNAQGLGKVEVKITYIVSSSSWEPTYELHATTSPSTGKPNPKVTLHYRAYITQFTGEDWSNASLTLSTVSSSASASRSTLFGPPAVTEKMPYLKGVHIRPAVPFGRPGANAGGSFGAFGMLQNAQKQGDSTTTHAFNVPVQNSVFGGSAFGNAQSQSSGTSLFGNASSNNAPQQQQQQYRQLLQQQQQQQQQPPVALGHNHNPNPQSQSSGGVPGQLFGSSGGGGFGSGATDDEEFEQVNLPHPDIPLPTASSAAQISSEAENGGQQTQMQMQTTVVETPLAITYAVEGKVTIPSDGVKHQVPIAVLVFGSDGGQSQSQDGGKKDKEEDVVIEQGVVPRLDARVFLQCRVKNTSEYRLFPGRVSVILDDGYIAKTFIGDINTGDHFTCTLGTDPTTQIKYIRTSKVTRSQAGTFAEAFSVVTYNTKVTLSNKHSFDLKDVKVYDCVPVYSTGEKNQTQTQNQNQNQNNNGHKVSVILRKPAGLANAKEGVVVKVDPREGGEERDVNVRWELASVDGSGGEKSGKFRWQVGVPAGKKETLELEWEVRAPADLALVESLVM